MAGPQASADACNTVSVMRRCYLPGRWLVIPRANHYARAITVFADWIAKEVGLEKISRMR
jgi:hypothetical protein